MINTIGFDIVARSLALIAFGLDTTVELFASGVVAGAAVHEVIENWEEAGELFEGAPGS